jgi:hypothetical protein
MRIAAQGEPSNRLSSAPRLCSVARASSCSWSSSQFFLPLRDPPSTTECALWECAGPVPTSRLRCGPGIASLSEFTSSNGVVRALMQVIRLVDPPSKDLILSNSNSPAWLRPCVFLSLSGSSWLEREREGTGKKGGWLARGVPHPNTFASRHLHSPAQGSVLLP